MQSIPLIFRLLLSVVFLRAGLSKLADASGSEQSLSGLGSSGAMVRFTAMTLLLAEIAVAVCLLPARLAWYASMGALVLLTTRILGISRALIKDRKPDGHYFGQLHLGSSGWGLVARNVALAPIPCLLLYYGPHQPGFSIWIDALTPTLTLQLVIGCLCLAFLGFQTWFHFQLTGQNGRILLRLEAIEHQLQSLPHETQPWSQDQPSATAATPPAEGVAAGQKAPGLNLRPVTAQETVCERPWPMVVSRFGIVSTQNALASQTGAMVLERGGNAVDAAVAANAMLGLLDPSVSGLGGDLFAIVYEAKTKKLHGLNASGWTPAGLTLNFLTRKGLTAMPQHSIHTVTVPGAPAGWDALVSRLGKLDLARVLAPTIYYAENGVAASEALASNLARLQKSRSSGPDLKIVYLPSGQAPRIGELFRNPALAASLRRLAEKGRDGFYKGPTADAILGLSSKLGGPMTRADLEEFQPEWVEPISTTYRDWTVSELPPNSYGFAALAMLNIMEHFPLREYGHNTAIALHVMIEAKKSAYANIIAHLGDPRFATVPIAELISKKLADDSAKLIDMEHADCRLLPGEVTAGADRMGHDTIYLSAVDADGNIVSLIQSNASEWGSGLVPPGCGFVLHDRGGNFDMKPGQPNSLAGRKRPLHTNMPGFMASGDVRIAFGNILGWNQAQAQAQFVSNIVDFGMDIQAAISAARFCKRSFSGCGVMLEARVPQAVRSDLKRLGHRLHMEPAFTHHMGIGQAVMRDANGTNYGGSDPRVDGAAAAFQNATSYDSGLPAPSQLR